MPPSAFVQLGQPLEVAADGGPQRVEALRVQRAHAANVAREVAFVHEVGEHGLHDTRRLPVHEFSRVHEGFHEIGREHEIAEPQRGEEDLAEGARVEHVLARVDALQRRERAAR